MKLLYLTFALSSFHRYLLWFWHLATMEMMEGMFLTEDICLKGQHNWDM